MVTGILEYLGITQFTTSKAVYREGEECTKTRPISTRWFGRVEDGEVNTTLVRKKGNELSL